MMQITLQQVGKRFNHHWIFRKVDAVLQSNVPVAITGANGSGKSTLLQVIGGAVEKSEGSMSWLHHGQPVPDEQQYPLLSFCTPYLELIEELTLLEMLQFHGRFKPWLPGLDANSIIALMGLEAATQKQIRAFSSGMKQRVKLAQSILSAAPVLLLDEPTSNLDTKGIDMYHQWMQQYTKDKLVLIASNDEQEISFCQQRISMAEYK